MVSRTTAGQSFYFHHVCNRIIHVLRRVVIIVDLGKFRFSLRIAY